MRIARLLVPSNSAMRRYYLQARRGIRGDDPEGQFGQYHREPSATRQPGAGRHKQDALLAEDHRDRFWRRWEPSTSTRSARLAGSYSTSQIRALSRMRSTASIKSPRAVCCASSCVASASSVDYWIAPSPSWPIFRSFPWRIRSSQPPRPSPPASVGTLDAIHLATAVQLAKAGKLNALMTYDKGLAAGAREHGITVLSPS